MSFYAPSFNGGPNLQSFIDSIHANDKYLTGSRLSTSNKSETTGGKVLTWFNKQLFKCFNPDINGYIICFMVPPPFDGLPDKDNDYIQMFRKLTAFAAVEFTPPKRQLEHESTSARTGGIPFATEMAPTQDCSVSYIDNYDLDIYNFHTVWVDYVHNLLEGYIEPPSKYYNDPNSELFGGLDYAGSMFFVKYDVAMHHIKYVGKATGIVPQGLPSKEILGQRSANEVTTLPFNYKSAYYEETVNPDHEVWKELEGKLNEAFGS